MPLLPTVHLRWVFALLFSFSLWGCAVHRASLPVSPVSVAVEDRFGTLQGKVTVVVQREKKRKRPMENPTETIDSKETDSRGRLTFSDLVVKDRIHAKSIDGRFYGSVVVDSSNDSYRLKLDSHSGFTVNHRGIADDLDYKKASDGLRAILDHYTETNARTFLSRSTSM